MEDCLVFADNGFLKLVKRYFEDEAGKRLRLLQIFRNICKNEDLNLKHLFFYWAPPFQGRVLSRNEVSRRKKYDVLKKMFDKKKWITYREGRCQKIYNSDGSVSFNQKGVDSLMVADLCLFGKDFPDVKKIIVITSDSDFAPIFEIIREKMSIEVILYTFFKRGSLFCRTDHLLKSCSRYVKFRLEDFEDGK